MRRLGLPGPGAFALPTTVGRRDHSEGADPPEQGFAAILSPGQSPRAIAYRRHHGIADEGGTAVTVQAMVFGNIDQNSGTGVFFTRDPATGERRPYGDFLPGGQGEDVVSGTVSPMHL